MRYPFRKENLQLRFRYPASYAGIIFFIVKVLLPSTLLLDVEVHVNALPNFIIFYGLP